MKSYVPDIFSEIINRVGDQSYEIKPDYQKSVRDRYV